MEIESSVPQNSGGAALATNPQPLLIPENDEDAVDDVEEEE